MNKYLKLFWGVMFVLALTACGGASQPEIPPQSADVSLDCNKTTGWCLGEVTNNSETEPMNVKPTIDVAYKGSEVQMDEDHVNPVGQTWSNFFYLKDEVASYRIQPGDKLTFKWRGNPGLYRFTVNTSGYGDTVTYSYTGYTPTLSNENTYRLTCKPDSISVVTSSTSYTGWGTAIYINDQRWGVIVDVATQLTEIELPRPEFNVDPKRININTDKWDDFIEVERDNHTDHKNAVFCTYDYVVVTPSPIPSTSE